MTENYTPVSILIKHSNPKGVYWVSNNTHFPKTGMFATKQQAIANAPEHEILLDSLGKLIKDAR